MYDAVSELDSFLLIIMERRIVVKAHTRRPIAPMLRMVIETPRIRMATYYLVPSLTLRFDL